MEEEAGNSSSRSANGNKNNVGGGGVVLGGGFLETSKAERAVWLMKCPSLVARSLQASPSTEDPYRPVAKVVLSIDPLNSNDDDTSSPQFTMELTGIDSGNVPKSYSMEMSKDFIPMSVFSESAQGKISVEGKILNKFDMRPHNENLENYGKLCRERTNKYMTKNRKVQVIDNGKGTHMGPMPGMISSGIDKKKVPTKGSDMKRTRRDRGEMEAITFKLFERQPNWTLRQLIQETDQPESANTVGWLVKPGNRLEDSKDGFGGKPPYFCIAIGDMIEDELPKLFSRKIRLTALAKLRRALILTDRQFLKDILKELCVYNNKGTNQGSYELKPEYKRSGEEPALM